MPQVDWDAEFSSAGLTATAPPPPAPVAPVEKKVPPRAVDWDNAFQEQGFVKETPQYTGKIPAGSDPYEDNHPVIQSAKKYLGTPYVFGSTDKKRGLDCSSFVQSTYGDIGISLPRTAREQYKATQRVDTPRPGDLVFLKGTQSSLPDDVASHVMIYAGGGKLIQAASGGRSREVRFDGLNSSYAQKHFLGFGRVNGAPAVAKAKPSASPFVLSPGTQQNPPIPANISTITDAFAQPVKKGKQVYKPPLPSLLAQATKQSYAPTRLGAPVPPTVKIAPVSAPTQAYRDPYSEEPIIPRDVAIGDPIALEQYNALPPNLRDVVDQNMAQAAAEGRRNARADAEIIRNAFIVATGGVAGIARAGVAGLAKVAGGAIAGEAARAGGNALKGKRLNTILENDQPMGQGFLGNTQRAFDKTLVQREIGEAIQTGDTDRILNLAREMKAMEDAGETGIVADSLAGLASFGPEIAGMTVGGKINRLAGVGVLLHGNYDAAHASAMADAFTHAGADLTNPDSVNAVLTDPQAMDTIHQYAIAKGVPEAVVNTAGMELGGVLAGRVAPQGVGIIRAALGGLANQSVQALGMGGGYAAGQMAVGEPIDPATLASTVGTGLVLGGLMEAPRIGGAIGRAIKGKPVTPRLGESRLLPESPERLALPADIPSRSRARTMPNVELPAGTEPIPMGGEGPAKAEARADLEYTRPNWKNPAKAKLNSLADAAKLDLKAVDEVTANDLGPALEYARGMAAEQWDDAGYRKNWQRIAARLEKTLQQSKDANAKADAEYATAPPEAPATAKEAPDLAPKPQTPAPVAKGKPGKAPSPTSEQKLVVVRASGSHRRPGPDKARTAIGEPLVQHDSLGITKGWHNVFGNQHLKEAVYVDTPELRAKVRATEGLSIAKDQRIADWNVYTKAAKSKEPSPAPAPKGGADLPSAGREAKVIEDPYAGRVAPADTSKVVIDTGGEKPAPKPLADMTDAELNSLMDKRVMLEVKDQALTDSQGWKLAHGGDGLVFRKKSDVPIEKAKLMWKAGGETYYSAGGETYVKPPYKEGLFHQISTAEYRKRYASSSEPATAPKPEATGLANQVQAREAAADKAAKQPADILNRERGSKYQEQIGRTARIVEGLDEVLAAGEENGAPLTKETIAKYKRMRLDAMNKLNKLRASGSPEDIQAESLESPEVSLASPNEARRKPQADTSSRVMPAPLRDGTPAKRLPDIVLDLQKSLGKRIQVGVIKGKAIGRYFPGSAKVLLKYSNHLSTIGHEISHALDDAYHIVGAWEKRIHPSPFDSELLQPAFQHTAKERMPRWMKRAEGVAEWFRAYIFNPEEARRLAPDFYKHVQDTVAPDVLAKIDAFGRDVRRWSALPEAEKLKSNIRLTIPKQSILQKGKALLVKPTYEFETSPIQHIQKMLFDRMDPLARAIKKAFELRGEPENADAMVSAMRRQSGIMSKIEAVIEHGMIQAKGRAVAKGTEGGFDKALLGGFDQSSEAALQTDIADTSAYMIAQRAVHYAEKVAARDGVKPESINLSNIGGGIYSDYASHVKQLADFEKLPAARRKVIVDGANRYRTWANSILQYLKDSDVISQESIHVIRAENPYYVDMHRVIDDLDKTELLQTFKGSTREIDNPYVNLRASTYRAIEFGDRNAFLKNVRDMLTSGRKMYEGAPKDFAAIGSRAKAGDKDTIGILVDGKMEKWTFESDLYDTIKKWGDSGQSNIITKYAGMIRNAITHSPDFLVRNVIRDTSSRAVVTDIPGNPFSHSNLKQNQKLLTEFRLAGGDQAGHYISNKQDFHKEQAKAVRHLAKDKNTILSTPGMLLDKYKALARESELVNRLSEYARAKEHALKQGMSEGEAQDFAAGKARDLMDFAIAGDLVRIINSYVPFTNASIQGLRRSMRAAKTNPAGFAARWTAYVLMPSLVEYAWNYNSGDKDEYRQLPAYQRDYFWNFKAGADTWIRIPKAFEQGVMASGVTRAIDYAAGNKDAFGGYEGSAFRALAPIDESALAGGPLSWIVESIANYDFFREKAIVSPYENDLLLPLRKGTKNASRLGRGGQWLSEQVGLGVDARKIDNAILSNFGGLGRTAIAISNADDKTRNRKVVFGNAAVGLLTTSPVYQARDVQYVLRKAKSINKGSAAPIRALNDLIGEAYDATTNRQRAEKGKQVRERAKELRPLVDAWEREALANRKITKGKSYSPNGPQAPN